MAILNSTYWRKLTFGLMFALTGCRSLVPGHAIEPTIGCGSPMVAPRQCLAMGAGPAALPLRPAQTLSLASPLCFNTSEEPAWIPGFCLGAQAAPLPGDPCATSGNPPAACGSPEPFAPVCPPRISFREDARQLLPDLWDDTVATATWKNAVIIGLAGAGAIALRTDIDRSVRADVAEHPQRWGEASRGLRVFGEPSAQTPALLALYGYSVYTQNAELHEFSVATIHAWGLSSLTTVAIKGIADTRRPSDQFLDGRYGFPSFHTSSTFSIAAVVEDYYGWKAGLPAYALAGLVGWSRIDQQEHDLSDVLFGAVLGYVIGKSVAAAHQERHTWQVQPWIGPQNTSGLVLEVPY